MKPVSIGSGPSGPSTVTVRTCPPTSSSASNSWTRCCLPSSCAAVRPLTPAPTMAMSMSVRRSPGEVVEGALHAVAGVLRDAPERTARERLDQAEKPLEADVGHVVDPGARGGRHERDVVDRPDAGTVAGEDHPARRLEAGDLVLHRRDPAGHPDAEPVAGTDAGRPGIH